MPGALFFAISPFGYAEINRRFRVVRFGKKEKPGVPGFVIML